jgi:hypothetical protein
MNHQRLRPKQVVLAAGIAAVGVLGVWIGAARAQAVPQTTQLRVRNPELARGRYLVIIGSCNDCHTPLKMGPKGPEPDMSRMLSGHPQQMVMPRPPALAPDSPWNWSGAATSTAFAGPFGVSYAHNLTPDKKTGLGSWTEKQFDDAMRTGKHLGLASGRPILPPMPWQSVGEMTDQDLHAVWLYLQSIPPIDNQAPESIPAPPPPHAEPH